MVLIKDRKKVLKSLFMIIIFLLIGILVHIALISVVTFFHLQLDHRFVDIQDWIYANGWFLHILKSISSFYIIEKIISIVNYENNGLSKIFQDFKLDINYKVPTFIVAVLLLSSLISYLPVTNSIQNIKLGSLLLSYLGHLTFFFINTIFILLLFNKVHLEKASKAFVSVIYVSLVYLTEQVFFKFQENHERISIFFLIVLIYLSSISNKKHLNLVFALITFFICPLLVFFGLDLIWGSENSPFVIRASFNFLDVAYLSAAVGFFLYLESKASGQKS